MELLKSYLSSGDWKPSLARLKLSGSINAWMGSGTDSLLQVK